MGSRIALCMLLVAPAAAAKDRRIEVRASPTEVTLGGEGEQTVELDIRVHGGSLAETDVILHSTAGEVVGLEETAPGRYRAQLRRPKESFPQLVVVTAADLSGVAVGEPPEIGTATVAYSARTMLSGRTEAKARMEVRIGKRRYGPVRADDHGQFSIPVLVKPGEMYAQGISRDALGNTSRSRINMYLPEVQRVHGFVYPRELIADGADSGWMFVTTVSHSGALEDATIRVKAARGETERPERLDRGVFRVTYRAPAGVGDGVDRVTVVRKKMRQEIEVRLISAAPARAEATVTPQPALANGAVQPVVDLDVRDAHDNPVADQIVALVLDGDAVPVSQPTPGAYRAVLPARETVGRSRAEIRVTPASTGCRRGRLVRGTSGWHVVDARGVGCAGHFRVLHPDGRSAREGELASRGLLLDAKPLIQAFADGARLEVDGAEPRRIAIQAGARPTRGVELAEPVLLGETVFWQLPTSVDLSIREVSREGGRVRVRVEMRGIEDPAARVRVTAGDAAVEIVAHDGNAIEASIAAPPPLDVVASDVETGVAVWARIE